MNKAVTVGWGVLAASISLGVHSSEQKPSNIIFMIGDGMGPAYTTAYRYYQDDPATPAVDNTIFDQLLVGMAQTYPKDRTIVTDSAASATALSTGIKTYNGAIAMDVKRQPITTMLEMAKQRGMVTGLVATSQINHATPASFIAHNISRRNYDQIADDYVDNQVNDRPAVDLLLGGGTRYFVREDRDLVAELKAFGYQYRDNFTQLNELNSLPAIGLFAEKALPFALDDPEQGDRLSQMTQRALTLLEQSQQDFFVMIEGSQIDWCGHANDIACAMAEMDDFAKAVEQAKAYIDRHPDTLLVVTADHSTGGLTLGAKGKYKWETEVIKGVRSTAWPIAHALLKADDIDTVWQTHVDWPLNEAERAQLVKAKQAEKPDAALYAAVRDIINLRSYTGWTTKGHTAIDVQVFAYGHGAHAFVGGQDNTDIAKRIIEVLPTQKGK